MGAVGWLVPVSLALNKPTLIVAGGNGGHNSPEKIADGNFQNVDCITWILPDKYCKKCGNLRHECSKKISNFKEKAASWIQKVKN
jgi:hypothetical protein